LLEASNYIRIKSNHDNLIIFKSRIFNVFEELRKQLRATFYLHINLFALRNSPEHLNEGWHSSSGKFLTMVSPDIQLPQFLQGRFFNNQFSASDPSRVFIMDANNVTIFAQVEIPFDSIRPSFPREQKSR